MKTFFKALFEYNHHFNHKLCAVYEAEQEKISERATNLFCHIINAHQIWNNRIHPLQPILGVWDTHPIVDCKRIDQNNFAQSLFILENFELTQTISYSNSKGQNFSKTVRDMLFHTINHSTYHRGQIATALKQNGIEPIPTDYIFYTK